MPKLSLFFYNRQIIMQKKFRLPSFSKPIDKSTSFKILAEFKSSITKLHSCLLSHFSFQKRFQRIVVMKNNKVKHCIFSKLNC